MMSKRPQPPQPDRIRAISGSFSWIDHRFFRQGFDQGLTRLEKLLYLVLVAVSNRDGVSFYSLCSELTYVVYKQLVTAIMAYFSKSCGINRLAFWAGKLRT
jgi:hypothetical protein